MYLINEREPKISNIKAHFILNSNKIGNLWTYSIKEEVKRYHNFLVWKTNFTYIIFFTKRFFVNVTSIKNENDVEKSLQFFCQHYHLDPLLDLDRSPVVDNITSSIHLIQHYNDGDDKDEEKEIDFALISKYLSSTIKREEDDRDRDRDRKEKCDNDAHRFTAFYDLQYFPGLFLKHKERLGTVLLFHSGKISIVGVKCLQHLRQIHQDILALTRELLKIREKEQ